MLCQQERAARTFLPLYKIISSILDVCWELYTLNWIYAVVEKYRCNEMSDKVLLEFEVS
jgi:hypothetical protein